MESSQNSKVVPLGLLTTLFSVSTNNSNELLFSYHLSQDSPNVQDLLLVLGFYDKRQF